MNEHLRDRILRTLETMSDERGYQVLDYAQFLETKYAERQAPIGNTFTRFTDAVEDKLRAGKVSANAIAETIGFMNRAAGALNTALDATRAAASEIVSPPPRTPARPPVPGNPPPASAPASSPAHDTPAPGSGEEKL